MSKKSKPWYYKQTGCYYVWIANKKHKLLRGKKSPANQQKAQDILDDFLYEARHNVPVAAPPEDHTVASVIEAYLKVARKTLAASTMETRRPYLQSFAEDYGQQLVSESKKADIENWKLAHTEWESDWTKHNAVRGVQIAFNWAVDKDVIPKNPFKGYSHRPGAPRRDMTPDEFQAILRATVGRNGKRPSPGARFRQVLIFLWFTGCRPAEAAHLTWDQVEWKNNRLVIPEHKTSRTQKIPKPRIIPLHPCVVKLLRSIQRREEGEHVFLTYRKTVWNRHALAQRISRAREIAGVPDEVKLYGTRHAFGTRGVLSGLDLKTISTLMGHTTTRVTENYLHLAGQDHHLAAAMQLVNARRPTP